MPTIDDFTRPKEWIPDMVLEIWKAGNIKYYNELADKKLGKNN